MVYLYTFIAAIIAGVLYRLGGWKEKGIRRFGVPFVACLVMYFILGLKAPWWIYFLTYGAMYGAMTSYFSELCKPHDDVNWIEWLVTGLAYGATAVFVCGFLGLWLGLIIRIIALGILTMAWSVAIGWDILEEFGRGFLFIITLLILLI